MRFPSSQTFASRSNALRNVAVALGNAAPTDTARISLAAAAAASTSTTAASQPHRFVSPARFRCLAAAALALTCAATCALSSSVLPSASTAPSADKLLARLARPFALAFAVPAASASCGFAWEHRPSSPFMASSDYRFQYVEHIADAELSASPQTTDSKIPLNLLFSPVQGAYHSNLLGKNWWFPAVESTLLQANEGTFTLSLPNGEKVSLKKTSASTMAGGSWLGTIRYDDITLKSSCGWRMVFKFGRLVELYSPKSEKYEFVILRDGTRTVTYNSKVILTIKRKFNEKSLFYDYYVFYISGGKQHTAILKMGERPIIQQMTYFDANDRPATRDEQRNTNTLRALQIDNAPEKRFDFGMNEVSVSGRLFVWERGNNNLIRDGEKQFSFVTIKGIPCFKTQTKDDWFLKGEKEFLSVSQVKGEPAIVREYLRFENRAESILRVRREWEVSSSGERLTRQYWFDVNGELKRSYDGKNKRHFNKNGNSETCTSSQSKEIIWRKTFTSDGKICEFYANGKTYLFSYSDKEETVRVTCKKNGNILHDKEIPLEKTLLLLSVLNRE
jgi:hypothetical protein